MGTGLAASLPLSPQGAAAQTRGARPRASAISRSPPGTVPMPGKGRNFVVVARITLAPLRASSSPSVRSSVVFPPPPITAVTPFRTPRISASISVPPLVVLPVE